MTVDGLIFDLDGTLWDSTDACVDGWNEALSSLGHERAVSRQEIEGIMGLPHNEALLKMFPQASESERGVIDRECFEAELRAIRDRGGVLFPGVEAGLKRLSEQFRLFIVSNCRPVYLATFLQCTGLGNLFADTECFGNTGRSKGENISLVVKRNGLRNPAYFGDTAGDHQAALRAGVPYFHVNYGFGEPIGECWRFDNFSELTAFFLSDSLLGSG